MSPTLWGLPARMGNASCFLSPGSHPAPAEGPQDPPGTGSLSFPRARAGSTVPPGILCPLFLEPEIALRQSPACQDPDHHRLGLNSSAESSPQDLRKGLCSGTRALKRWLRSNEVIRGP